MTKNIDEAENISAHARTTCSAAISVTVTSLDASSGDGSVSQLQCFGDGSAWKTNTQRAPVTNESTAVDVDVEPAAGAATASLISLSAYKASTKLSRGKRLNKVQ